MTTDGTELLSVVVEICKGRNAQATFSSALKGGLLAGAGAFVGGLLLGPPGLAVGGAVGGGLGAASTNFRPLHQVIMEELTSAERSELLRRVAAAVPNIGSQDALSALLLAADHDAVLNAIKSFFEQVKRIAIRYD